MMTRFKDEDALALFELAPVLMSDPTRADAPLAWLANGKRGTRHVSATRRSAALCFGYFPRPSAQVLTLKPSEALAGNYCGSCVTRMLATRICEGDASLERLLVDILEVERARERAASATGAAEAVQVSSQMARLEAILGASLATGLPARFEAHVESLLDALATERGHLTEHLASAREATHREAVLDLLTTPLMSRLPAWVGTTQECTLLGIPSVYSNGESVLDVLAHWRNQAAQGVPPEQRHADAVAAMTARGLRNLSQVYALDHGDLTRVLAAVAGAGLADTSQVTETAIQSSWSATATATAVRMVNSWESRFARLQAATNTVRIAVASSVTEWSPFEAALEFGLVQRGPDRQGWRCAVLDVTEATAEAMSAAAALTSPSGPSVVVSQVGFDVDQRLLETALGLWEPQEAPAGLGDFDQALRSAELLLRPHASEAVRSVRVAVPAHQPARSMRA